MLSGSDYAAKVSLSLLLRRSSSTTPSPTGLAMPLFAVSSVDYAIVISYLGIVIGLGLWLGRGQKNLADYLLGGRDLPWWAVLGSIVATETSTVTFLSIPGAVAHETGNLTFLQLPLGYILGRFVVAAVLLPSYFRGEIYTAYEVLHRRFGGATKTMASLMFLVARNLGDGLRLFLAALVLDKLIGIPFTWCVILLGTATIIYTVFGGMKSVVWNDCLQLVVYLLGACIALGTIVSLLPGGWADIEQFARQENKLQMFDFSFTLDRSRPYTFWAGLIGGMFLTTATHGADQLMVQRYLSARSRRDAALAVVLSGFVVFVQFLLFVIVGLGLAAFYQGQTFQSKDAIFPDFIVKYMPIGVAGLTLAAVFAAAMSTLSSSLNSSAASAVRDLLLPALRQQPSDAATLNIGRGLTVLFGIVQILVGIWGRGLEQSTIDNVLAIAGFTTGIILGVFFLGLATRKVKQQSAVAGLIGGLAAVSLAAFYYKIAWPWFTVVGVFSTLACGLIAHATVAAFRGPTDEASSSPRTDQPPPK
jgi:solute:Na+ symporter, SSS family